MSSPLFVPFFAAIGLILGSFGNVLILRYGSKNWVGGRSKCPRCKHQLAWYDLLPVASFVLLGGKCRYCSKPISAQYPSIELASSAVFLLALNRISDQPLLAMLSGIILYMLLITAVVDAKHHQIPDIFSIVIAVAGLVSVALFGSMQDALMGMLVGAGWFGWQWLLSRGTWVGSGDILLAGALGLWLGFWPTIAMLVLAYGSGAITAAVLLARGDIRMKNTHLGFAPFMAVGTVMSFLGAADWYLSFLR